MSKVSRALVSRFTNAKVGFGSAEDRAAILKNLSNRKANVNIGTIAAAAIASNVCSRQHWKHEDLVSEIFARGYFEKTGMIGPLMKFGAGRLNVNNKTYQPTFSYMRPLTTGEIDEMVDLIVKLNAEKVLAARHLEQGIKAPSSSHHM